MLQTALPIAYPRMTREDRLAQIADIINRSQEPLSARQIARRAGLRKSPYLMGLLEDIDARWGLQRTTAALHNGLTVFLYHFEDTAND